MPLADEIRPVNMDDIAGQKHILDKNKPLRLIIESGKIPNLIFYGPPGVGKTTVARIAAESAGKKLYKLNGTSASTGDIKSIIGELDTFSGRNGVILYLDEIQYLNKKQQQSLLEYIENGQITLVASTTENPYFYIYGAVLSRCTVFEFKPVDPDEMKKLIRRAFGILQDKHEIPYIVEDEAVELIAYNCGGDARKALNSTELCALTAPLVDGVRKITPSLTRELLQKSVIRYDKDGDEHYDLLSALQKSIRGSDENAALHYLARLLEAGDLLSPCRRLLVTAAEDIGLAHPQAIVVTKACVDSALQVGLPEAQILLSQAVIFLATAPKSNSAYRAIAAAQEDIRKGLSGPIPRNLMNKHYDGDDVEKKGQFYLYPHNYENHYIEQQYLPDAIKNRIYYEFGGNKIEQTAKKYRNMLLNLE